MKKEVTFKEENYIVRKPKAQDEKDARRYSNVVYGKAVEQGVKTKAYIERLSKSNADDGTKEIEEELRGKLNKLAAGGYPKLEARKDAISAFNLRTKWMVAKSSSSTTRTAENMADEAYNEYIMSCCCMKENGSPVYASPLKYSEESDTELADFLYSSLQELLGDGNALDSWEEVKFLKKYGYMNDKYELINENGEIVDEDFKVVEKTEFTEFTD